MYRWIAENHQALASIASIGTLVVWTIYLHLFLSSYRRQRRVKILIGKGPGEGTDSRCLVGNMSSQAIYVVCVVVRLNGAGKDATAAVTEGAGDGEDFARRNLTKDIAEATRQGPLRPGHVYDIGSFRTIAEEALATSTQEGVVPAAAEVSELELTVIAAYGSEDLLCGARRRFAIEGPSHARRIQPLDVLTAQIRSRSQRRELSRLLERYQ